MKATERILLIFLALVLFLLTAGTVVLAWTDTLNTDLFDIVEAMQSSLLLQLAVSLVGLVIAVLSIRIMFAGISSGRKSQSVTLAKATEIGGIYINLETVSSIATKAVRRAENIMEIRVKTEMTEGGVAVALKVSLAPDTVIPEACAEVQNNVKTDVEMLCGLHVKKVSVQVDNTLQATK